MNPVVTHLASGLAFFPGVISIIAATWMARESSSKWSRLADVLFFVGFALVVLSSTPIHLLVAILIAASTIWWIDTRRQSRPPITFYSSFLVTAMWLVAIALELPYHSVPTCSVNKRKPITVIGDSVTAGLGDDRIETWPQILERSHGHQMEDVSHVGETARSARKRIGDGQLDSSLVIIEIGGNDLLGGRTAGEFAADLESLLQLLTQFDRKLLMFELPLPPFHHGYARAQRSLAKKYGVQLIPKRVLMSVHAGEEATLDSIHLSAEGQKRLAEHVAAVLGAESS